MISGAIDDDFRTNSQTLHGNGVGFETVVFSTTTPATSTGCNAGHWSQNSGPANLHVDS